MRLVGTWLIAIGIAICLLDLASYNRKASVLGLAMVIGGSALLFVSRSGPARRAAEEGRDGGEPGRRGAEHLGS